MNRIPFVEAYLDNGIKVIVSENSRIPIVILLIGFKVGSKNEPKGKKGLAHLLEHLMFSGGYDKEMNYFDKMLALNGGDSNAVTSYDYTYYYIQIPSHKLEFALELDTDRFTTMGFDDKSLNIQKKVVIEEKKEAYDNTPYGDVEMLCAKNLFKNTDYEVPVIGLEKDINNLTVTDISNFFYEYYNSNNCIISIVGNINCNKTLKLLNKYYSRILKNANKIYKFSDCDFKSPIELYPTSKIKIDLNSKFIFFKIPARTSREYYILRMISIILGDGFSSRLYKNLIYERKVAHSIYVSPSSFEHSGMFEINILFDDGKKDKEIEQIIFEEIDSLKNGNFTEEEFQKAKNKVQLAFANGYQKNLALAQALFYYEFFFNNVKLINEDVNNYLGITKEDIIDSACRYLDYNKRLVITYLKG
ncbi:MAG: insulinase family protein [Ignavibacteria bacterium]|nr:insulinase family protein [Ignavibacteria bacterium]